MKLILRVFWIIFLLNTITALSFADSIVDSITFDANRIIIVTQDNYYTVQYKDINSSLNYSTGSPLLPSYNFKVLVPHNAVNFEIKIISETSEIMAEQYNAFPVQEIDYESSGNFIEPDTNVYSQNVMFPDGSTISLLSVNCGYSSNS